MPVYEYKGIIGEKNTYTDGIIEAINDDEAAFRLHPCGCTAIPRCQPCSETHRDRFRDSS